MNPAIEQLRPLCRLGFNGERLFNQDGHLDLVHYTREFRGVREVVLVSSERTALAYRTRDMLDPDSPLHITENAVEWRLHGDVVTVDWRMNLYGGAEHSFTHPKAADPSQRGLPGIKYHQPSNERSWRAMLDLFEEVFPRASGTS